MSGSSGKGSSRPDKGNAPAAAGTNAPGSSAIGEVLAHASGSSDSGGLGLLLPLALIGVLVWAIAYLLRQRTQRTTPPVR